MEGAEVDQDYEDLVARLAAQHGLPKPPPPEDGEGPERPYSNVEEVPERETTQTDQLNARLLSAFDKLLESGQFKMPADLDDDGEWNEHDGEE
jgi:hypothetical protein